VEGQIVYAVQEVDGGFVSPGIFIGHEHDHPIVAKRLRGFADILWGHEVTFACGDVILGKVVIVQQSTYILYNSGNRAVVTFNALA
jgi:hypothetical protein